MHWKRMFVWIMILFITGCSVQPQSSLPTVTDEPRPVALPTEIATIPPVSEASPTPEITPTEVSVLLDEAIQITSPRQAETMDNPFRITGVVDSTLGDAVYVRLVDLDSTELGSTNLTITNPASQYVPFEVLIEYQVSESEDAILQVYLIDPASNTISHLNSRMVKLVPVDPPTVGQKQTKEILQIDGARVMQNNNKLELQADGLAGNLFENNLSYSLCGEGGTGDWDLICGSKDNVMLTGATTITTPEVGGTGPFHLRIPLENGQWRRAHLVIYSISPANGEVTHAASILVKNGP